LTRRKLKIDPEFNFILIGVATPLQDYRMAWFVNNVLYKTLAKIDDLVITDPVNKIQTAYARFDFDEELTKSKFHLLQNKNGPNWLIPELKELDYLLIIRGEYYRPRKNDILKKLRAIEQIQAVVIIEPDTLKSKNNLIFEENFKKPLGIPNINKL
jgi:hypothetical protein